MRQLGRNCRRFQLCMLFDMINLYIHDLVSNLTSRAGEQRRVGRGIIWSGELGRCLDIRIGAVVVLAEKGRAETVCL